MGRDQRIVPWIARRGLYQLIEPIDKGAFWDRHWDIESRVNDNVLARRALQVPSLHRTYLETLLACAISASAPASPDSPIGWLEAETDAVIRQIRDAGHLDRNTRFTAERFDDELQERAAIQPRTRAVRRPRGQPRSCCAKYGSAKMIGGRVARRKNGGYAWQFAAMGAQSFSDAGTSTCMPAPLR